MPTERSHPREYFDMYGVLLDLGGWSYVVDDTSVRYVNDWYPYSKSVRVAPDVASYSWRNEYVGVRPGPEPHLAGARLRLSIRRQGSGVMAVNVDATLDLRADTATFQPDDLTGDLLHQAKVKARRLLDLLAAERLRQRTAPHPVTAAELEQQRERECEQPR
jgi:Tfp pilus assembly protein PilN